MRTISQLLAIAGLGLILGITHAIARTAVFDQPGVTLRDIVAAQPNEPVPDPPTEPEPSTTPESDPEPEEPADISAEQPPAEIDPLDAPVNPGQITLREAYELFEQGAWFLDARSRSDFDAGFIEGAIWMPAFHASTNAGQDDLNFIPEGDVVIIYCTGGDCDASKNTQRRLALLQYNFDVRILGKGYIDWIEADLPVTLPEGEDASSKPEGDSP